MATGIWHASIPAIAREAGVSIPTVYRHFGTKDELFREVYPYTVQRARVGELLEPTSLADLGASTRSLFDRLEAFDDMARAAMASPAADTVRELTMDTRIATSRRMADVVAPQLSTENRERLSRLLIILSMSATLRMWRDRMGRSVDEAVDDVEWIVRSVIAGAEASTAPPRRQDR